MKAFATFVGIGGLATALQYGLMIFLIEWLTISPVLASASSYAISALVNYTANYYLTFKSNAQHLQTFAKFMLATAVVLMVNTLLFSFFFKAGLHYLWAQIIATLITLFVNFIIHRFWIYRK